MKQLISLRNKIKVLEALTEKQSADLSDIDMPAGMQDEGLIKCTGGWPGTPSGEDDGSPYQQRFKITQLGTEFLKNNS